MEESKAAEAAPETQLTASQLDDLYKNRTLMVGHKINMVVLSLKEIWSEVNRCMTIRESCIKAQEAEKKAAELSAAKEEALINKVSGQLKTDGASS